MKKNIFLLFILIFGLIIASCTASKNTTSSSTTTTGTINTGSINIDTSTQTLSVKSSGSVDYTYAENVKPIIDKNCANTCHSTQYKSGGIDLTNYENVKNLSVEGILISALQHEDGILPMPKNAPKLSSDKIQIIIDWVSYGANE